MLHYKETGNPERPTLVLLHGMGLDHRMWQPQLDGLGQHYHVVAPDLLGFGRSATPKTITMGHAAAAVADLIRERCGKPVHLCGLSLGAMVAVQVALDAPGQVKSLILSGGQVKPPRLLMRLQQLMLLFIPEKKLLEPTEAPFMTDELRAAERDMVENLGKRGLMRVMREASRINFRPYLASISQPTLVLCGAKDHKINHRAAQELADKIPVAELRVIPEVGHIWNLENSGRFNQEVLDFVNKIETQATTASQRFESK